MVKDLYYLEVPGRKQPRQGPLRLGLLAKLVKQPTFAREQRRDPAPTDFTRRPAPKLPPGETGADAPFSG